jgi:hypothetical protein
VLDGIVGDMEGSSNRTELNDSNRALLAMKNDDRQSIWKSSSEDGLQLRIDGMRHPLCSPVWLAAS